MPHVQETSPAREILTECLKVMIIFESRHILRVAIDPVRQRRSECLGTLNAACEKFLSLKAQRREFVLERARGVYEFNTVH